MEIKKIYAGDNEKGILLCDQCGKIRSLNLAEFKNIGMPLKVKCECGHVFFIRIEVRKFYRKSAHLVGEYVRISNDISAERARGRMIVEDVSRTGLRFCTKIKHHLCEEYVIQVKFILDNDRHSEVIQRAVVKRVSDYSVGAEFLDFDIFNEANRALGSYLMSS